MRITLTLTTLFALLLAPLSFASAACITGIPATMTLSSELSSTVASTAVGFHTVLRNESNTFQTGELPVEVVRTSDGTVVDRFLAAQSVTLLPGSAGKADFAWRVPSGIPSGSYSIEAVLAASSTSRADIYSGVLQPLATTSVAVNGGIPEASITSLSVNGQNYQSGSVVQLAGAGAQVITTIANQTSGPYVGTFTWRLYASDATLADPPLDTKTEPAELQPNTSGSATYALTDASQGGYFLEGELSNGKSSSYIDVALARDPGAFPELRCAQAQMPAASSSNPTLVIVIIILLLVFAAGWTFYERRRGAAV